MTWFVMGSWAVYPIDRSKQAAQAKEGAMYPTCPALQA